VVAADRGHKVTLIEKSDSLGGTLKFADRDAYKGDLGRFKDVMIRRVGKREIRVVLGREFSEADVAAFGADAVVIAVGATPVIPPIPGIERAMKAVDVYDNMGKIGQKVVLIGGGLVGSEVGLHLAANGRDVTVIEMLGEVARDAYRMHRVGLLREMARTLTVRIEQRCTAVSERGVTVVGKDGKEEFLSADTVVYAVGMAAKREEAQRMRSAAGNVPAYEIGDCACAAKVYDAVRQGFVAAMSIL